jgi:hypothetical protein
MSLKPGFGFKIWTSVLSLFVAGMLFPSIIGRHGVGKSILITALAVGAIWLMYLVIGRLIDQAAAEELRRRVRKGPRDENDEKD